MGGGKMTTHGHRKYTMSAAAIQQRRMARRARKYVPRPSRAGTSVGLHITEQAAAVVLSYPMGKKRRAFITDAILHHSQSANDSAPLTH